MDFVPNFLKCSYSMNVSLHSQYRQNDPEVFIWTDIDNMDTMSDWMNEVNQSGSFQASVVK